MLELKEILDSGWYRDCYLHPNDKNKMLKVQKDGKDELLLVDLQNYKKILALCVEIQKFLPKIENELIQTDKGKALICEIIRDDNSQISQNLEVYIQNHTLSKNLATQIDTFLKLIRKYNINLFDIINMKNFLVQIKNGEENLFFIDFKRLNSTDKENNFCFKLPFISKFKLFRRSLRLKKRLGIKKILAEN